MNVSTPRHPRTSQHRSASSTHGPARLLEHGTHRAPTARPRRDPDAVSPVEFVEPDHTRPAPEHHPRADRSADTMRRLRAPFTPGAAEASGTR